MVMTEQDKALIRALRCYEKAARGEETDCTGCPYLAFEWYNGEMLDGCDQQRIDTDAANRLEELTGGKHMKNQKYIVRGDSSGVFYGEIESRDGQDVVMKNARCLWRWYGAASLMQLALEGVSEPENCKFTVTVDSLEVLDAIEILPCTDAAVKSIEAVKPWKV
jgi:hypothetical protein